MMRHSSDENILLLAHGELSAWRLLQTQWHLRRCPLCRARYAAFAQTSAAFAAELRGSDAAPWQPAPPRLPVRFVIASGITAVLLVGVLCGLFYFTVHLESTPSPSVSRARPSSSGCAPNLPDDRCR